MNFKSKKKAKQLRIDTFNAFIARGEAHVGGSLLSKLL